MARFRALRLLGRVRVRQAQPFEKVETEIRDSWMVLPEGLWICGCGMEETNEVSREGGMEDEEEVNQLTASFSSSGLIVGGSLELELLLLHFCSDTAGEGGHRSRVRRTEKKAKKRTRSARRSWEAEMKEERARLAYCWGKQ